MPAQSNDITPGIYPPLKTNNTAFQNQPNVTHNSGDPSGQPSTPGWSHTILPTSTEDTAAYGTVYDTIAEPKPEKVNETNVHIERTGSEDILFPKKKSGKWSNFTSREKHFTVTLAISSVLALTFMIATIVLGMNQSTEEYVLPSRSPTTTLIPPWLTFATTTTKPTTTKAPTAPTTMTTTTKAPTAPTTMTTTTKAPTAPTTMTTTTKASGWNTCLDANCAVASGRMLASMTSDPQIDRCDNFYEYACGGWIAANEIPESMGAWDVVADSKQEIQRRIKAIFETDVTQEDAQPIQLTQQFYDACLAADDSDGQARLNQLLSSLNIADDDATNLAVTLALIQKKLGQNFIFDLSIDVDEKSGQKLSVYMDQPSFGLPRPFLIENTGHAAAYRNLIGKAFSTIFGSDDASSTGIAKRVFEFEQKLAEISTAPEDRRNKTTMYNPVLVSNFPTDKLAWSMVFTELFTNLVDIPVENMTVILQDLDYFKNLSDPLGQFTAEEIENYLKWRIIFSLANDVSSDLRDLVHKFEQETQGVLAPVQRWKKCTDEANSFLGMAVAYKYIRKHFNLDFKTQVDEVISDVKEAFNVSIARADWISDDVKAGAVSKIEKLRSLTAYPDWLDVDVDNSTEMSPDMPFNLVSFYTGLTLTEGTSHFQNLLDILQWRSDAMLRRVNDTVDPERWSKDVVTPGAFYLQRYNNLVVPAGVLQIPFYGLPLQYLNYAAIGFKLGHEIGHSLNPEGIQYDSSGMLTNWWDEASLANFTQRTECMVDQYSYLGGLDGLGKRTLEENAADNIGLKLALEAYRIYVQRAGSSEKVLPGFDALGFSAEQLFFLSYAQNFCGSYTQEMMELQLKGMPHSPHSLRVNGTLYNFLDFDTLFSCPERPEPRCSLW